jgi:hypothetical protein
MTNLIVLGILIGILVLLLVALLALFILGRQSRIQAPFSTRLMVADAKVEKYERPSSIVSEQIEEVVKHKLAQYPDLADTVLDFGTMPDGTIDIWVNKKQYDNVEDIPDERIRAAVKEAVEEFNKLGRR